MKESKGGYSPEIQEQRDELAKEVRNIRKQRDEKREAGGTLKSKLLGRAGVLEAEADTLNTEARRRLNKGRRAIERAIHTSELGLQELESAGTDHNLIRWYFKKIRGNVEAHPIATDTFIDRSREEYNAAWLARELVQNFIDHNPKARGTLNGVSVEKAATSDGKAKRYTITGDWPFEDPTGVISPHSEKPTDVNTAGGNGIGLKQTAIRYLRDFGVSKFEIQGENWVVDYQLVKAAEVNAEIGVTSAKAEQQVDKKMRHDWLIGQLKPTEQGGKCVYIIETDDATVMAALDQLENLGVSTKNEFLQNPDFENTRGAIKWLPQQEGQMSRGRLFINGQVMNYGSKGSNAENYWVGPEYVTLQLNDVAYKMSVDRPPIQSYELQMYLSALVRSMTIEQVMEQFQRSEQIWTTLDDVRDRSTGAMVVISAMIDRLRWDRKFNKDAYQQYFGDKKYLAKDGGLSSQQEKDLRGQGYTLCPSDFEYIGMPKASSKLSNLEIAANQKPDAYMADSAMERLAEESGLQVAHEDLSQLKPDQLIALVKDRANALGSEFEVSQENPNVVRIKLNIDLPKELLAKILPNPKTDQQKLLHFLRGVALQGLENNVFKRIYLAQGEYVSTFSTHYDHDTDEQVLFIRNTKAASDEGVFVELEFEDTFIQLKDVLRGGDKVTVEETVPVSQNVAPIQPDVDLQENVAATAQEVIDDKKPTEVIAKEAKSPLPEKQVAKLEEVAPGIASAIKQLESATATVEPAKAEEKDRMDKYREWKDSEQAIKVAGENAGYINGRALGEIVSAYNKAKIPVAAAISTAHLEKEKAVSKLQSLTETLQKAVNKVNPDGKVDDFEMIFAPEARQLAQLGLLRIYVYLTTGAKVENQLFIFRGSGTTGINMGKEAIGIHERELDQSFLEAVGIFTHELAHNEHMDHKVGFMTTMEALFLATQQKLTEIALKARNGEALNENEETILSLKDNWDKLRSAVEETAPTGRLIDGKPSPEASRERRVA